MQMVHGLAAIFAGVHHDAVAFRQAFVAGDLCCHTHEVTEQRVLLRSGLGKRINMLARNDQHVHGSLGIDVGKGIGVFVLVDGSGGNLAGRRERSAVTWCGELEAPERQPQIPFDLDRAKGKSKNNRRSFGSSARGGLAQDDS
jgi:hypothetical protein